MVATHIEFASDVEESTCSHCTRNTVRETMLVNGYGLVLARTTTCVHCGHRRHRAASAKQDAREPRVA